MSQEVWEELYNRFDPTRPVPLDRPEWHATRTYDLQEGLRREFALPGPTKLLYLGTTGTGKSTELRRLALSQAEHSFVLLLDLVDHFDRNVGNNALLQRISAWEVCFLAGLALYQAAVERLSLAWPPAVLEQLESAWRAAAQATSTPTPARELDLSALATSVLSKASVVLGGAAGPLGSAALAVAADALKNIPWSLPLGRAERALGGDSDAGRGLLAAVNRIIGEIQGRHRRVVLIIDGLDRIDEGGNERVRQVFIETDILARLACRSVICGPFRLRHDLDVSTVRGYRPVLHVNEPVLEKSDPGRLGGGFAFCRDLYLRRAAELGGEGLIPDPLLRRIAYYSGGRARDLVELIRRVAGEAMLDKAPAVTEAMVAGVLNEERRIKEMGLHSGHIDLLRKVAADPEHRLPQDELAWDLLRTWRLLPYPNQSEWYFPHPLLTLSLVPLPAAPGSAPGTG